MINITTLTYFDVFCNIRHLIMSCGLMFIMSKRKVIINGCDVAAADCI